jgi:Flp pilus assembly protein TadD
MVILHDIGDYLYGLFPAADGRVELLPGVMADAYAIGPYKPRVIVDGSQVRVEIDEAVIKHQHSDYRKVVKLCEAGDYAKARPILERLIVESPQVSEYYRILGQILSDLGENDKATDSLIEALRWDPRNQAALVMMANLQSKVQGQHASALRYLREAHRLAPKDVTVLNNLGGMEMRAGELATARSLFEQALEIDPDFPQALFAMGCLEADEGEHQEAVGFALRILRSGKGDGAFRQHVLKYALIWAEAYADKLGTTMRDGYAAKLEVLGGKPVRYQDGLTGAAAASIQLAEPHGRDHHLLRYRSDAPALLHHQMHELEHLELALEARAENKNCVIISDGEHYAAFRKTMAAQIAKLRAEDLPEENLSGFLQSVFHGLVGLAYNAPIDLIIELRLHQEFPQLRPVQLLSLNGFVMDGLSSVTDSVTVQHVAPDILTAVRVYNLSLAMLFDELYGVNLVKDFRPTATEKQRATMLLNEAKGICRDRIAGAEYKLLLRFADLLRTSSYFQLVDEQEHLGSLQSTQDLLDAVEADPLGLDSDSIEKDRKADQFTAGQQTIKDAIGLNMAVAHFMVDAIKHFAPLSQPEIQAIAMDCAMTGANGISPNKDGYTLKTVPGQTFSGNRLLAWFYASFALSVPKMLSELGLPFDKEWEWAQGESA